MYFYSIYKQLILQNIMIPSFGAIETDSMLLKKPFISVGVENSIGVQAQFAYLFFLTKKRPYMARKHPPKKKHRFAGRVQSCKIASFPSKNRFNYVMHNMYHKFMGNQLSPELSSLRLAGNFTKVIVWNAPLDFKTFGLQINANLFVDDIPIFVKFNSKNFLWDETAFFLDFFCFLRHNSTAWLTLELEDYKYAF